MPYTPPNPLDALKKLLAGSPDLNAGDPSGMVQGRLHQEDQAEEDFRRFQNASSDGSGVSGATPSTFKNLADTLNTSPNFGAEAQGRVRGITDANDRAMQAGFTGDSDIATPLPGDLAAHPSHEQIYANVNRSSLSPSQQAGQSAARVEAVKTQMPLLAAQAKAQGDIQAEHAKGDEARRTGQAEFDRTANFLRPQGPVPQGTPNPAAQPSQSTQSAQSPQTSQSWNQYAFGGGARPENDLMSSLKAMGERAKYSVMSTPLAPMIQNESFGNLEQLQAQFPGVRGFSYLLPKLKEHQANFGKGETIDASYNRLSGMIDIMKQVEQEMGDPASHATMGDHGQLKITNTPAAIQRALMAVQDTRKRFEASKQQLKSQYPALQEPAAAASASSRFVRVPE